MRSRAFDTDWDVVEHRLKKFSGLRAHFPIDALRRRTDPAFGCNGFAWRLGAWHDESLVARFDELLVGAAALPNWSQEKAILTDPAFQKFWTVLWQLQVAEFLSAIGRDPSWQPAGGADLVTATPHGFVECFALVGTADVEHVLADVVGAIHPNLHVWIDPTRGLQKGSGIQVLIEQVEETIARNLQQALKDSAERWPQVVYRSPQSGPIVVYLEGDDIDAHDPSAFHPPIPDAFTYLESTLERVTSAKAGKNKLSSSHPNALFANLLLPTEPQLAASHLETLGEPLPQMQLPPSIDAACWCVLGIDQALVDVDLQWTFASTAGPEWRDCPTRRCS